MFSQRGSQVSSTGSQPHPPMPFHVMVKPGGPRCNLDCRYCYYLEKERLYPDTRKFRMSDDVLEIFIRDYIASQSRLAMPEIWFSWQGGEPTLLGIAFFRKVVDLEEKYCPKGKVVRNAIQTNGTLLDEDWAAFFKANDFLVGISIDGPREQHDRYRVDRRDMPTFGKVVAALELLRDQKVEFNTLTVVHRQNARRPKEVYRFLKDMGVEFMQFIPLVERAAEGGMLAGPPEQEGGATRVRITPWSVSPKAYGEFLCGVFDEWIQQDVGHIFVQLFDVQLGLWMGGPSSLCIFAETCGQQMALEHNGDLYACDHYVYPQHLLGNIAKTSLDVLAGSRGQRQFGDDKRNTLPNCCLTCEYRFACNGGCPKHRFLETPDGEPSLNYFCASYRRFFEHAGPYLLTMANLVRQGQPAARVMEMRRNRHLQGKSIGGQSGRNEPCPCGSGRKFKKCCGREAGR
ncbi:anaerobic sulfatase maturase [Martelella soudanensis]|uniref:anaerobic sulfatase maturase n=1 Tax=unclassified Martelella TaxID=2629616 RepID=UPI001AEDC420|nr:MULTISPECIES: anaerobic sulfatase maturase [unclassified Martelella]